MNLLSTKTALLRVIILTLLPLVAGCAYIERHYGESCNTRAYVASDVDTFLRSRFLKNSPVRVAVIPFTVPANLAAYSNEFPGIGNELAWKVQAEFLQKQAFPIVEVLNRQDWPGKKEEFFTGNFGALTHAMDAGYDLALVGLVESGDRLDTLVVDTKLIEVESGITLWYGRTRVVTDRKDMEAVSSFLFLTDNRPDLMYYDALIDKASRCIVTEIMAESVY